LFISKDLVLLQKSASLGEKITVDWFNSLTRNKGTITSRNEGPLFKDFSRKKLYKNKLRSGEKRYFNKKSKEKNLFPNILGFLEMF